jgi:hypothetical protein
MEEATTFLPEVFVLADNSNHQLELNRDCWDLRLVSHNKDTGRTPSLLPDAILFFPT